jgi:hypothetical protein
MAARRQSSGVEANAGSQGPTDVRQHELRKAPRHRDRHICLRERDACQPGLRFRGCHIERLI